MTLARVISHQGHKARPHFQNFMPLSKREIEVLNSLMAGKSNQVIAQELYLSPLTVKNHVQNIMKKLRVKTRGLAVTTGVRLGLIMSDGESGGEQNA
jgi:DNA-binding NarL/FixJ family response regulator